MKTLAFTILTMLFVTSLLSQNICAQENSEASLETIENALEEHNTLIDEMLTSDIEMIDKARVKFYKTLGEQVLESLRTKGFMHNETYNAFNIFLQSHRFHRFSEGFLNQNGSDYNREQITRIQEIIGYLRQQRGEPTATHTYAAFVPASNALRLLIEVTKGRSLSDSLTAETLTALLVRLGKLLASAKTTSDVSVSLRQMGVTSYCEIRSIYDELVLENREDYIFNIAMDLIGPAEYYAEIAEIDEDDCNQEGALR